MISSLYVYGVWKSMIYLPRLASCPPDPRDQAGQQENKTSCHEIYPAR